MPDVLASDLGGEAVLMNVKSGEYFGLPGVGATVWEELAIGGKSVADLVNRVTSEYDIDEASALRDIQNLLAAMREAKLVEFLP